MSLVTLRTYTSQSELAVVRSLLDSEGIETIVLNENLIQVQPFLSNAIGGIKLQVFEEDYEKADKILTEASLASPHNNTVDEEKSDDTGDPEDKNSKQLRCPFCNSDEVVREKFSLPVFAISILLLGAPIPFISRRYHCFDCGRDFKYKPGAVNG